MEPGQGGSRDLQARDRGGGVRGVLHLGATGGETRGRARENSTVKRVETRERVPERYFSLSFWLSRDLFYVSCLVRVSATQKKLHGPQDRDAGRPGPGRQPQAQPSALFSLDSPESYTPFSHTLCEPSALSENLSAMLH